MNPNMLPLKLTNYIIPSHRKYVIGRISSSFMFSLNLSYILEAHYHLRASMCYRDRRQVINDCYWKNKNNHAYFKYYTQGSNLLHA